MVSKNTICLWYDGTALDAAKFYAETFPNSEAVLKSYSVVRARGGGLRLLAKGQAFPINDPANR